MTESDTDHVQCRCGRTWDRSRIFQCPEDGTDLWDITVTPPPPPPPPPPGGAPSTTLDAPPARAEGLELVACGTLLALDPGATLALGRDESYPTAAVFHERTNISRFHAVLRYDDTGRLFVTDTESVNGTYINDIRLAADTEYEVRPGQRLRLAANVPIDVRWPR